MGEEEFFLKDDADAAPVGGNKDVLFRIRQDPSVQDDPPGQGPLQPGQETEQ